MPWVRKACRVNQAGAKEFADNIFSIESIGGGKPLTDDERSRLVELERYIDEGCETLRSVVSEPPYYYLSVSCSLARIFQPSGSS